MGNTYFQFKQFRIEQSGCAMKVCTDACIFGAWYAQRIQQATMVLDIGSGTGLLMMMLAQQSAATIHGIEIEDACYHQLQQNISEHEWSHRMQTFHGDARVFKFPVKYDFIISNPPFYDKDLSSANNGRQLAMHSSALKLDELAEVISGNLTATGSAGILLPAHRAEAFDKAAVKVGMMPADRLLIRHTTAHPWFRTITTYVKGDRKINPGELSNEELTIRNSDGTYTHSFMTLLADYYL